MDRLWDSQHFDRHNHLRRRDVDHLASADAYLEKDRVYIVVQPLSSVRIS